jgi:glycosyltransferase involved in cell wall biosynthesis
MSKSYEVKRLLCIVSAMNVGGAETFLMKIYRTLDKSRYQMDFYCMSLEEGYYEKEIRQLGGRVYHAQPKSRHFIKSFIKLKETVKHEKYEYVLRVSQHSLATIDLVAAKLGGAKVVAQRSSNSDSSGNLSRMLHLLFKGLPIMVPTIKIAPSTEAGVYTFGKRSIGKKTLAIIKNAISLEDFSYRPEIRDKIRKKMGMEGKYVVGHIGRFSKQKNHDFLIDVFAEIEKIHADSILVLIGKGELESDIKRKIKDCGLNDKVVFLGVRGDISEILMVIDVFVFPSYFEGMPNTVIEAQATGLPCLISDTITREAKITDLVEYISLNQKAKEWAIVALKYNNFVRKDMRESLIDKGYDIKSVTSEFEKLIFG